MRIVIAPDSFKESLSAREAAEAIAAGWQSARSDDEVLLVPIADGGEGTVDALVAAAGGWIAHETVTGPMGDPVRAHYGVLSAGPTAVVEMAASSGLALVPAEVRDPLVATTRGAGELLLAASCVKDVAKIVIGIGGSATNDGGAGFAQALGYRLLDKTGHELPPGGAALAALAKIEPPETPLNLPELVVACDVNNPLCGPHGASAIYGPQKGATPAQVAQLDAALAHYADVVEEFLGQAFRAVPGAGAAGGLGFALMAFAGATLRPGIEIVAELTHLAEQMALCDLVITGEGRADAQSLMGKAVGGVLAMAARQGKPVVVLAGSLGRGHEAMLGAGAVAVEAIGDPALPLGDRLASAAEDLRVAAERLAAQWEL